MILLLVWGGAERVHGQGLADEARRLELQLTEQVMPYWYDTAQDPKHGGYLLADSQEGERQATSKQLVTQSRMIWGFAHVHRMGFRDPERNYLEAARQGYEFLRNHFHDGEHGGYFWSTDPKGEPQNKRKILYGQAFVIYALVEYHRASGEPQPLEAAMALYRTLQQHAHDSEHQGWFEHFELDWRPIMKPESGAPVEVPGYKSANAHLHWMEALTELYDVTGDNPVQASLKEALRLNATYFYPPDPGQSDFHRQPDWDPVSDPSSAGLSYGHNVEFAWLMIRAERALGEQPSWEHFYAHLNHALRYGYDHDRGGLYNRGFDDEPATQRDKIWWVEAEMLAALTESLDYRANADHEQALQSLLAFLQRHQIDPDDGIWYESVTEQGRIKSGAKAHNWKANYHDVRAMVKFIRAFGEK